MIIKQLILKTYALSDLVLNFLIKMKTVVVKDIERENIGTKPIAHTDQLDC